jgi:hypothetical protein
LGQKQENRLSTLFKDAHQLYEFIYRISTQARNVSSSSSRQNKVLRKSPEVDK